MNRIDKRFDMLREPGRAAFIPFLTAGDPDLDTTLRVLEGAEQAGADLIELGFPFSDPIADGPTIQASYTRVLERGQHVSDVFQLVEKARRNGCELPIVAMVSYSLVYRMGFERFLERALEAGIDGATVPDLPVEEAERFFPMAQEKGFHLVCFVTPATRESRRKMVARHAAGFIYYISVCGITGERTALPSDLQDNLSELRTITDTPIAVGFGISAPDQGRAVAEIADGVIVGSAIVKRMHAAATGDTADDPADAALEFIGQMADAVQSA
jgi:tryptophan synthase alpha chain